MIPAMAVYQNLNLVNVNNNNQATVEQEFIFKCLCNVSDKNPLDLRQWYLIPVRGDQWCNIINDCQSAGNSEKDDIALHIILSKKANSPITLYGAYPTDASFSFIPSPSRFSWEKAFYSAENESGINDPSYDEKIVVNKSIKEKFGQQEVYSVRIQVYI